MSTDYPTRTMQLGRRAAQVGGSVRDSRMNTDEKKSGVKVKNAEESSPDGGVVKNYRRLRRTESVGVSDARRSFSKSEAGVEVVEPRSPKLRSPIQLRKSKSETCKEVNDGSEKKAIQIRKTKSDCGKNPIQRKLVSSSSVGTRSDPKSCNEAGVGREKSSVCTNEAGVSGEKSSVCTNEAGVGGEKREVCNVGEDQTETKALVGDDNEEEKDKGVVEEIEIEEKAIVDIKKVHTIPEKEEEEEEEEEEEDDDYYNDNYEEEEEEQKIVVGVIVNKEEKNVDYHDKTHQQFEKMKETQSKIQNLVELVMWKDVSKSAFVLGVGSFVIISSSYTKDVNFSVISVMSYIGLVYLASTFFYRSILCRGNNIQIEESNHYLIGEEEAAWLLHLILPYLNGFLFQFRSLFSGDPATTLKLAVILYVLAQCGSSITLWKMAKLGFFGAFTVPKICSSYSKQLIEYGNFWRRRLKDAWDSCSHKKAIAAATFTLIWNMSSVTARVWALFMLVVVVRYYQQSLCLLRSEWEEEQELSREEEAYNQGAHERTQTQNGILNNKKHS